MEDLDMPTGGTPVLNRGFIHLEAQHAHDIDVANAARVSFAKKSGLVCPVCGEVETACDTYCPGRDGTHGPMKLSAADSGLIGYLASGKHGTPFEHTFFKWHVKAPIFVFREWHRHRIGWSYNEWSARYSKMRPEFYVPARDDVRHQVGKPGAYTFERVESDAVATAVQSDVALSQERSYKMYEDMLEAGVAKEVARVVLPVGMYSQMHATCNARSLMAFLSLRNSEFAQREIRVYAAQMENIFARVMPRTHEVFVENGRVAP